MVRGCERRVVYLKNPESFLFEEVFFILKEKKDEKPPTEEAMVREATRILQENMNDGEKEERPMTPRYITAIMTVLGFCFGLAFAFILAIIL